MGRNDPSDVVSERPTEKKGRSELTETSSECSWDLDPVWQNMLTNTWTTLFLIEH